MHIWMIGLFEMGPLMVSTWIDKVIYGWNTLLINRIWEIPVGSGFGVYQFQKISTTFFGW